MGPHGWGRMAMNMADQAVDEVYEDQEKDLSVHSFTLSTGCSWPNAVKWSFDGRIAILTDNVIHVLAFNNSTKRRQPGEEFGLTFDSSVIPITPFQCGDVGISPDEFGNGGFKERQQFVLDYGTVRDRSVYTDPDCYSNLHWSPLGCTSDGRSILATQSANGEIYIHTLSNMLGKWEPTFPVTKHLQDYLKQNAWFTDEMEGKCTEQDLQYEMQEYCRRKHLLYTVTFAWCPLVWTCNDCLVNQHPENMYYTNYFINFASCCHGKYMFCTASRTGHLFLWNLTYHKRHVAKNDLEVAFVYDTKTTWPFSSSWFQYSTNDVLIAVGYTQGTVTLLHFRVNYNTEGNGQQTISFVDKHNIWDDIDEISVTNLAFIRTKLGRLNLIAIKGTEILIFRELSIGPLRSVSCEQAPTCHSSPIVSLQTVKDRFIVTASHGATQYVDIEDEINPFCDSNILRGFRCCGLAADPSLCMFVRVSCPSRLLLLQSSFVKQMEVCFLPFLSTEDIAQLLLNEEIDMDIIVCEYFLISTAENFILPNVLHPFCEAPESYDLSTRKLQIYLYFNRVRYMQTTGMRANALTNEEVKKTWTSNVNKIEDEIIKKINKAIEIQFFKEMLCKFLQLHENEWLVLTDEGSLSLRLICDFILRYDTTDEGRDLSKRAFIAFKDGECVEMVSNLHSDQDATRGKSAVSSLDEQETLPQSKDVPVSETSSKANEILDKNYETSHLINTELSVESTLQQNLWEQFREHCPYCGADICLTDVQQEKCRNGHKYVRCALTLRACKLKTYRVCIGCDRKVLTKCLSGKLDVESILLNIDVCPFCGCRFIEYHR